MIRERARMASFGRAILIAHLFLSPLLFWRATSEAFETNKLALLLLVSGISAAFAWTIVALGRRRCTAPLEPVLVGVIAVLASAAISTVISISPRTSFWGTAEAPAGLLTVLGYALLFFATRHFFSNLQDARTLLNATLGAAAVASIYALLQTANLDPFTWEDYSAVAGFNRPFSTFGHPNFLGAYLAMAVPVALEFARRSAAERRWRSVAFAVVVAGLSMAAIVASLSRAAGLALAVAWLILAVGWYVAGHRHAALGLALAPVFMFGCGLLFSSSELRAAYRERLDQLSGLGSRQFLWTAGWQMFLDHPIVGCGLDTFQLAFAGKRTPEYWGVEWNVTPARAHNEFIHVLATQGLVGGIAIFSLLTGVAVSIRRSWRRVESTDRGMVAAIAAAVCGYIVQSVFAFTVVGCGTCFVTLVALLSRSAASVTSLPRSEPLSTTPIRRIGVGVAWVGAVLLCIYCVMKPIRASIASANGERTIASNIPKALIHFEQAVAFEPGREAHWVKLGSAAHAAAKTSRTVDERSALLQQAHVAYVRAATLVPANSYHYANVGRITAELTRLLQAPAGDVFTAFDTALKMDPHNAYIRAEAANAALALGEVTRATDYAAHGIVHFPTFAPLTAISGYVAMQQGQLDDAATSLAASLAADWHGDGHGRHFAWNALVLTLTRMKRFDDAAAQAWGMTQYWPDRPDVHCLWAKALESAGHRRDAIAAYELVVGRWPANPQAIEALRRLKPADDSLGPRASSSSGH